MSEPGEMKKGQTEGWGGNDRELRKTKREKTPL